MNKETVKPEKVIRDGKVAVLYSSGHGAGWSTGEIRYRDFILFDKSLVEACERKADEAAVDKILTDKLGQDHNVYLGGWNTVKIAWIPEGEGFVINEYDGLEYITLQSSHTWKIARAT